MDRRLRNLIWRGAKVRPTDWRILCPALCTMSQDHLDKRDFLMFDRKLGLGRLILKKKVTFYFSITWWIKAEVLQPIEYIFRKFYWHFCSASSSISICEHIRNCIANGEIILNTFFLYNELVLVFAWCSFCLVRLNFQVFHLYQLHHSRLGLSLKCCCYGCVTYEDGHLLIPLVTHVTRTSEWE